MFFTGPGTIYKLNDKLYIGSSYHKLPDVVMSSYKTIQINPKEYDLLLELRSLLMERGTRSLEEGLEENIKVEEILRELDRDSLAKGAVAGLAIAIILRFLKLKEENALLEKRKGGT